MRASARARARPGKRLRPLARRRAARARARTSAASPPGARPALRPAARRSVPTLEAYLAPVLQQMDPSEGIEAAFKKCNDKAYAWKALRLMHRTDLQLDDKYVRGGLEAVAAAVAGI